MTQSGRDFLDPAYYDECRYDNYRNITMLKCQYLSSLLTIFNTYPVLPAKRLVDTTEFGLNGFVFIYITYIYVLFFYITIIFYDTLLYLIHITGIKSLLVNIYT